MKIKIIFVVVFLGAFALGGIVAWKVVSKIKDKEFARTEKVYVKTIDRYATAYETLAGKARYMISQTLTVKKNKKGQIIYVPSSTMEIDRIVEKLNEEIKAPIDTSTIDIGNK